MFYKKCIVPFTLILVLVTWMVSVSGVTAQGLVKSQNSGLAALDRAANANKYLFVFFYRQDDAQTRSAGEIVRSAVSAASSRADMASISITDPSEAGIVTKFGVDKAPMPIVLAIAPNGAIVANFVNNFTKQQILDSFVSPSMEALLKSLQQGKLVLLCVQNGKTRLNSEAMNGVRELKSDHGFSQATEVIMVDPGEPAERPFLTKLGMTDPIADATTLMIAPPGSIIGSFKGATDKNQLVATLTNAAAGCGSGCNAGGCGVKN